MAVFTKKFQNILEILKTSTRENIKQNLMKEYVDINTYVQVHKNDPFALPVWSLVADEDQANVIRKIAMFIDLRPDSSREFEVIQAFPQNLREILMSNDLKYLLPIYPHVYMRIKDPVKRYLAFRDAIRRHSRNSFDNLRLETQSYYLTVKKHNEHLTKKFKELCNDTLDAYYKSMEPDPVEEGPVFAEIPLSDGNTYHMPVEKLHEVMSIVQEDVFFDVSIDDDEVAEMMDIDDPSGLSGAEDVKTED